MKNLYMRSMLALACAATLAACGGKDDGNLSLGGSVVGLSKTGLQLKNGSATLDVAANAGTFAFTERIASESNYDVQINKQPTGADCTVLNGKAKASNFNITSVVISCLTKQHKLGGTVSGLAASESVTLINAPEQLVQTGSGAFTFAFTVGEGNNYGVSVLKSSPGKVCSLPNGGGTMPTTDFNGLTVTCVPE
ncbi:MULTISPECIES: hypothetical protein [unclassified Janthinobacterium]|uniref:hypothetical protein n=1 Tax=unclassified Janthinobacterium TaxID=2610881 RepID=UPI00034D7838|nr:MULTISPECIES: hypothetical protein [unclassified Janthinobacterium]MEC5162420.1 hypothetical protein [Janthinobacterium sp. CG_S6]